MYMKTGCPGTRVKAVVRCTMWMLATKLRASETATSAFKHSHFSRPNFVVLWTKGDSTIQLCKHVAFFLSAYLLMDILADSVLTSVS